MVKNIPKTPQNRLENGQNWCQMGTKLTFLSLISLGQKPLRRRLRSRWFTERFHSNPLITHLQNAPGIPYRPAQPEPHDRPRPTRSARDPKATPS